MITGKLKRSINFTKRILYEIKPIYIKINTILLRTIAQKAANAQVNLIVMEV